MKFDANIPIYLQIMDIFKKAIVAGLYQPGDKIPSVRDLALSYGVNPNTVQRALSELERENMVYSERTSGRFITKDEQLVKTLKQAYADEQIDRCISELKQFGYENQEIIERVKGRLATWKAS